MTDETVQTNEAAANEDNSAPVVEETAVSQSHDDEPLEGEIVGGTWINPSIAADDPRRTSQTAQFAYTLPEGRPSFIRMIFGSVVILTEEVTQRASVYDDDDAPRQMVEAAIHQAASQEQAIDGRPFSDLRYGAIGLAGGLLDGAHNGAGHFSGMTHAVAGAAGKVIGPIWNSFLFAPFHEPVMRAEQAGESKVNEWVRRGRVEEVRSRALAEVSINNFVEESVTDLTENTQVQMIVQEVIASQSTSMIVEIMEEARERLVSLDLIVMGKLRQDTIAAPDFRPAYLQSLSQRRALYQYRGISNSLAGTFAGPVSRLVAFLLDVVVLLVTVGLISSFVSNALNLFGLTETVHSYLRMGGLISTVTVALIAAFNFLVISVYFVVSWNWTGTTAGNALFGLRVVNQEGTRVSFFRSILRLIGGYISAVVFMLGFIWALFDGRRQGWHDKFGSTFVLYDWPAKPEENFLHEQVMDELAEDGHV